MGLQKLYDKSKLRYRVPYEYVVWFVFLALTILAILDRFLWNVWPRQKFWIGSGIAATDKVDGLISGPWTVKAYDVIARISGRYSIAALNLLLFTTMNTFAAWLSESWLARKVVNCSDLKGANTRLHKWNGILLCVMTVIHVWSILFPVMINHYHLMVASGSFEWILSERKPPGFKDMNAETSTVMMQVDDVVRLVVMTLMLGILMPLSIHWLKTRWHLGIHVHRFIMVIYFVDIVRRHTHPHSWVFNTPFFFLWIFDNIVGYFWRKERPNVFRIQLSSDYMVLFWNQAKGSPGVGSKYFVRMIPSSLLERAHVFTAFENRMGMDMADGNVWSIGLVIRVYRSPRRPVLGRKDKYSHTLRLFEEEKPICVNTWGPYPGVMSESIVDSMARNKPFCLVAGGSAAGYILDALQLHGGLKSAPMTVLFTTRDPQLFRWMALWTMQILHHIDHENVHVIMALTSGGETVRADILEKVKDVEKESTNSRSSIDSDGALSFFTCHSEPGEPYVVERAFGTESEITREAASWTPTTTMGSTWVKELREPYIAEKPYGTDSEIMRDEISCTPTTTVESTWVKEAAAKKVGTLGLQLHAGRIPFQKFITKQSRVYFQGSASLQKTVQLACRHNHSELIAGPAFDKASTARASTPAQMQEDCVETP